MSPGLEVVIAGGGIAASATAIRLLSRGHRPRLLVRNVPPLPGIESTPVRTRELLAVLGCDDALEAAGAVECPGMAHDGEGAGGQVPSPVLHVDRSRLAEKLLAEATRRGAAVETVRRLPAAGSGVGITAVDATGRAAAWSRPLVTGRTEVAWQFEGPGQAPAAGRLARGEGWWAYWIPHPNATWASVVTSGAEAPTGTLVDGLRHLGLDPDALVPRGRRRANTQRAERPVDGGRIAVGDAALAHSPIAGAGIRFAVASAIAAAHVIATVGDDPTRRDAAVRYYEEMVLGEYARHVEAVERLQDPRPDAAPAAPPAVVRFAAEIVATSLTVDGRVTTGPAVRLVGGGTARWLGSFDLLELAELAREPTPRVLLVARLQRGGLDPSSARAVIAWSLRKGVLA